MPRVRPGAATRHRRQRTLRAAKGNWGARSKLFRTAKQIVIRGAANAFRDRRARKRDFRALWIIRISAACQQRQGEGGLSYSQFMHGLKKANVILNRKMLSEVAIADPAAFDTLMEMARAQQTAAA